MTMTTLKSPLMRCFVGAVLLTLAAGAHAEIRETPLAPVRIVWMSDTTGTDISNAESLLKPFSGQISVNDAANGARLRSRPGRTASLLLDFGKGLCRLRIRHRTADNLAARLLQRQNLGHGGGHILGPGVGHGLNQDRIASPYFSVAYLYYSRLLPVHGSLLFQNISSRNLQATYHAAFRKSLGAIPPLFQAPSCHNA